MPPNNSPSPRVGYVVKRYPRFSETFVVNEVLAHEAAGLDLEIFSVRPCTDTHFQNRLSLVKAPWTLLDPTACKSTVFLDMLRTGAKRFPDVWQAVQDDFVDSTSLTQAIDLARLVVERGITHLHAHFATLSATVAMWAARFAGVPFSLTAHAKDIFHEQVNPRELQQKFASAAAVITVSEFNVAYLVDRYGIKPKLHCVYNGLDLDDLPFDPAVRASRKLLAVGRLVKKKGFDDLIRACDLLRDRGIDFQCQIVGSGEQQPALRHLLDTLSLHDRVELLGNRPQADVKRLIREADLLVAPCVVSDDGDRDGLPTVLLESMALGTACVSTDVTGIPEIIEHERTGFIVPQANHAALAETLVSALDRVPLRQACALNARRLIEERFDSGETSRQLRDIFSACGPDARIRSPHALEVA